MKGRITVEFDLDEIRADIPPSDPLLQLSDEDFMDRAVDDFKNMLHVDDSVLTFRWELL